MTWFSTAQSVGCSCTRWRSLLLGSTRLCAPVTSRRPLYSFTVRLFLQSVSYSYVRQWPAGSAELRYVTTSIRF
ncbi:uncharacterized protein K460DRAFT_366406 [Cucurbitaria berberidis CBS 394.84]|uniref:Uncharacterized protein n=1 Tax=Cucurbitaria berberidis CBS 394.84 TaxID=1168544 RepID=A0A9P4L810_9PLEO|nr:uncharacterized protein K460DRAFT_366406 [Cucurbitaria berberidis CBS 394.84]KAF1845540.1 hypothetical protein K460DRAFT_366406 [Cucurbitaria berberidis CBS 394.84]